MAVSVDEIRQTIMAACHGSHAEVYCPMAFNIPPRGAKRRSRYRRSLLNFGEKPGFNTPRASFFQRRTG